MSTSEQREALADAIHQHRHPCHQRPVEPDYELADAVLAAGFRLVPEQPDEAMVEAFWRGAQMDYDDLGFHGGLSAVLDLLREAGE